MDTARRGRAKGDCLMNRHGWGAMVVGLLGGIAGAVGGCNFIVGVGDYSLVDAGVLHAETGTHKNERLLGDPCTKSAECKNGTCNGEWCTEPCKSNPACGS